MTVGEHLAELRRRLVISTVAVVVTTGASFAFAPRIFTFLKSRAPGTEFIYTQPTELISTYFRVALISGIVLALPVLLYQIVRFIAPGLTRDERRYVFLTLPGMMLAFTAGVTFAYFVLPRIFDFLFHTFGEGIAEPQIRISAFVSLELMLAFWLGIVFQLPIALFYLARLGVVTPELLSKIRRYALLGCFVVAAVVTPTFDPVTQTIVAGPIYALYELGVLLARLGRRRREAAAARSEMVTRP